MKTKMDSKKRFARFKSQTLFSLLPEDEQKLLEDLFQHYRLTFQEFRQLAEISRDLQMWGEGGLRTRLKDLPRDLRGTAGRSQKKQFLSSLQNAILKLKAQPKSYRDFKPQIPARIQATRLVNQKSDKKIFGWCPVASDKTVCCNLRTIDAVETCAFGCSYCTIQTFYSDRVVFDAELKRKLEQIELDPQRHYHIGTGQSSDALVWGNRNGMLDDLCDFARRHPNVLLEFKTKSANIGYFLENNTPPNIVCTWSLNPQTIIDNEEHYTVSLEKRLKAAEKVARRGIKVGFHFHPMIYYDEWEEAYPAIARRIMREFDPDQVLFISMGSVTFIKPVMKQIRRKGFPSKILQMELVPDPHGKWTYPDEVKVRMFRTLYQEFSPWHDRVFFYLCMEKAAIWERSFAWVFPNNEVFEAALLKSAFQKIGLPQR